MSNKSLFMLIGFLCVLLLIAIAGLFVTSPVVMSPAENVSSTPNIVETGGITIGQKYSLISHQGERITQDSFPEHYKLIYFGFTYCPDVCPAALHKMISAYETLAPERQEKLKLLFVTIDPDRDTQEVLSEYVDLFHQNLIGLTGSQEDIDQAIQSFRVYAQKDDSNDSEFYLMNHSSFLYLMGPDNTLLDVLNDDMNAADIATKVSNAILE